jgi:hypothetical protein
MSTTEIIECSCFQSRQKTGNSEWVTNIPRPVTLNAGDSLTVRQSILDANLSGEYTNITLTDDINIEMDFGYYYVNDGIDLTYGRGTALQAEPMGLYVARKQNTTGAPLLISNKTFTIPKKNYSAPELAEFISSQVSFIPAFKSLTEYNVLPNLLLTPNGLNNYKLPCIQFSIPDNVDEFNSITAFNVPISPNYQDAYVPGVAVEIYFDFNGDPGYIDVTIETINYQTGQIVFTPKYEYDIGGEIFITNVYMILKEPTSLRFYNQNYPIANDYIEASSERYAGTNQFALEYNINGSGKFQFTIMHTPPYPSDTDDDMSIRCLQYSTDPDLYFEDTRTGIFFTNLEPASFWNGILGFDLDTLIVVDGPEDSYKLSTPLQRGVNITSMYLGLDSIIGSTRQMATVPAAPYYYKTTITNPIISPLTYQSQDAGYMLIEVSAIPTSYSGEVKPLSGVVQIASTNWDSTGYITVYNDSSLIFTNTGTTPILMGSFRIRILSPLNYMPVNLLGPKSTIFLEKIPAEPIPK